MTLLSQPMPKGRSKRVNLDVLKHFLLSSLHDIQCFFQCRTLFTGRVDVYRTIIVVSSEDKWSVTQF